MEEENFKIETYYKPLGKSWSVGIIIFLLGFTLLGSVIAIANVLVTNWLASVIFTGIAAPLTGLILAAAARLFIHIGKIRNVKLSLILILICFFIPITYVRLATVDAQEHIYQLLYADYAAAGEIDSVSESQLYNETLPYMPEFVFEYIKNPVDVIESLKIINSMGAWNMVGFSTEAYTGIALWGLWTAEAILMLLPLLFAAKTSKQPFDEQSNKWMKDIVSKSRLVYFKEEEIENLKKDLENGNIECILNREKDTRHNQAVFSYIKFFKVKKENCGYISVWNQEILSAFKKDLYTDNDLTQKEIIPPIIIGKENVDKIETYMNS